ncbi:hotdog fold thioesterase [Paeniglutamicibacter sp. ZC-3]|uniref:PaaI family thioesterase n=1 Tax=Paeniglutamicibacter sp. ZC-3 TaxID=2986919 RepID=UPI0021F70F6D|nr:hotdog fold thioesterase [Paeniglutamicibacter sp. ZC-3]MCV9994839.1 hotdog fold thioesterase [Paeniglutamicibacter sp. ZC-3]
MKLWAQEFDIQELNDKAKGTLNAVLGIEITSFTETTLTGRMPVNEHTIQPAGVLHGGASVSLAETLASWAGSLTVDAARFHVVGQEINANHLRAGIAGQWVYGVASPIHVGRKTQVWEIRISNEVGKLVCISRCTLAVLETPGQYARAEERTKA